MEKQSIKAWMDNHPGLDWSRWLSLGNRCVYAPQWYDAALTTYPGTSFSTTLFQADSEIWPQGYKTFFVLNSTEHEIFLFINVKMPTIVGILTFMSGKNSIPDISETKKSHMSWYFYTYVHLKFHAQLSWVWKKFYNLGASLKNTGAVVQSIVSLMSSLRGQLVKCFTTF